MTTGRTITREEIDNIRYVIGAQINKIDSEFDYEWDDCPTWYLQVGELDIHFELANSEAYEGVETGETGGGWNAGWVACTREGEIKAQVYPYNYTNRVWTQDVQELTERVGRSLAILANWAEEQAG